jgi:hypothetical protein
MEYRVTRNCVYHGLELFEGEILNDHYDYINDPDAPMLEPDMYGPLVDRGWIEPIGQLQAVIDTEPVETVEETSKKGR